MSDRRSGAHPVLVLVVVAGATAIGIGALLALGNLNLLSPSSGRSTLPPAEYGTPKEIGSAGDAGNPRALFHGDFPSDGDTQERKIGGSPARFSGYTTWVRSVTRVPARRYVDGYAGSYLRLHVTVFNRDTETQHVCACDFYVWTRAAGRREADVVKAPTLAPDTEMRSGARLDGDVYLYVGTVRGPYYVVYHPDAHVAFASSKSRGVWRVAA